MYLKSGKLDKSADILWYNAHLVLPRRSNASWPCPGRPGASGIRRSSPGTWDPSGWLQYLWNMASSSQISSTL